MTEKNANNAPLKTKTKKVVKSKDNFKLDYTEGASTESPHNDITNVLNVLRNNFQEVEHEIDLPSNGKLGYPKTIKIREMSTEDEKILLKGLFSNEEKALDKLLERCIVTNFDLGLLTEFDRSFILVELSTLTFPGPKSYNVPLENGKTIPLTINVKDLQLNTIDDKIEYPFKVYLPRAELNIYLNFLNTKLLNDIEYFNKNYKDEHLKKIHVSMAKMTDRIEMAKDNIPININSWMDYVTLISSLKLSDQRIISDFIDDNITNKYGYKLEKDIFDVDSGQTTTVPINPLHFFRLGI